MGANPFSYLFPSTATIDDYLASLAFPRSDIYQQSLTLDPANYAGTLTYYRDPTVSTDFGVKALAQGANSAAFGAYSFASQDFTTAVGYQSAAIRQFATAIGEEASAAAYAATGVGRLAVVNAIRGTGVGAGAYLAAAATNGTVVGQAAVITAGAGNTVVGQAASCSGSNATVVGRSASVTVASGTGVGQGVSITGVRSTVIGAAATSAYADCVVVGASAASTAAGQIILGSATQVVTTVYMGRGVTHTGAAQNMAIRVSDAATGANITGDSLYLYGGGGTGTSAGGDIALFTATTGSITGPTTSTLNSFSPDAGPSLMTSLKAYYAMDLTVAGLLLDSVGTNNLTNNNSTTSTTGRVGAAGQFTAASSQYLSVSPNADLQISGNFSVACWVYIDSKADRMIACQYTDSANNRVWQLGYDSAGDRFYFRVYDSAGNADIVNANTFGAPALATWYFIAASRDGTNINISVNAGTQDSTASTRTQQTVTTPFRIGCRFNATPAADQFWNGRIDEFGKWDKVLSAQERTDLYNAGAGNNRSITTNETYTTNSPLERLRIKSSGVLDLSTTTPTQFIISGDGTVPSGVSGKGIVIHDATNNPFLLITGRATNATAFNISVVNGTECSISANRTGTGAYQPINFYTSATKYMTIATSGIVTMQAYGAGTATFDASGNISSVSDQRLKRDVVDLPYGLREVLQLRPIFHKWTQDSGMDNGVYPGFIAQDVGACMPKVEYVHPVSGLHSYSLIGIVGALVNSDKELNAKMSSFDTRLTALEARRG